MRVRTAVAVAVAVTAAAGSLAPAQAAPKKKPKPIVKSYTVQAIPHPNPPMGPSCSGSPRDVSENRQAIKVTGPGKLTVEVTGFVGDWDIGVFDAKDSNLAQGGGADAGNTETAPRETLVYKNKKAQTLNIDVCNFAGTPRANVKLVYTYL